MSKKSLKKREITAPVIVMPIQVVTWALFNKAVAAFVKHYRPMVHQERIVSVYGVPRGGLMLAVAISHHLGITLITDPEDIDPISTLVVDDVIESGRTREKYAVLHFAAWFDKTTFNQNAMVADMVDPDTWLVFPWEEQSKAELNRDNYTNSARCGTAD